MNTFKYEPIENIGDHVRIRNRLQMLKNYWRMNCIIRVEYIARIDELLRSAGVYGPVFSHLSDKCGCALVKLNTELDEQFVVETFDEVIAILDGLEKDGQVTRPAFRVHSERDIKSFKVDNKLVGQHVFHCIRHTSENATTIAIAHSEDTAREAIEADARKLSSSFESFDVFRLEGSKLTQLTLHPVCDNHQMVNLFYTIREVVVI